MQHAPDTTENGADFLLPVEAVESLEQLGGVLKPIYLRMKREGYGIVEGKLIKLDEHKNVSK